MIHEWMGGNPEGATRLPGMISWRGFGHVDRQPSLDLLLDSISTMFQPHTGPVSRAAQVFTSGGLRRGLVRTAVGHWNHLGSDRSLISDFYIGPRKGIPFSTIRSRWMFWFVSCVSRSFSSSSGPNRLRRRYVAHPNSF